MSGEFPSIAVAGGPVDARRYVEAGTGRAVFFAFGLAILGTLLGILVSYGILLIVFLCYPLFAWYLRRKATALIHGSGVHVGEAQFPEIHQCVNTFKARLGLQKDVLVGVGPQ